MAARATLINLLLGTALICTCRPAAALEPEDVLFFRAGPLSLKPQVAISESYNDNIFYLPEKTVQDLITTLSPGLKLQLGRVEHNYFALNYTLDQLFYMDNPTLDTTQHSIELRDRLEGEHLNLVGSDRIQFLSSPLGGVERVLSLRNIDRTVFDDNYTLTYNISEKTGAYLRGAYNASDYQEDVNLYDLDTLTGTGGFAYRAFPKTLVFGEVYYGHSATTPNSPALIENPTVDFVGGYVGARGFFTEKLSGGVKVGYESREFSDGSSAPSDPVVDLSLNEQFTEKTSLALSYSRQNNVSVQYTRQSYTADLMGLQLKQFLGSTRKWQASVGGSYARYQYDIIDSSSSGVQYDYVRASANLAYQIQLWLTANLGYDFESIKGDRPGVVDYTVNRVTLRFAIGY